MITPKNIMTCEHLDLLYNPKFICKRHDFTNWFCPYFDIEQEIIIPTCWKCGKVKNKKFAYVGRDKKGRRILEDFEK